MSLDLILKDSMNTPELDASFDEADTGSCSVSPGFLCLISTVFGMSRPQPAPGTISCKL